MDLSAIIVVVVLTVGSLGLLIGLEIYSRKNNRRRLAAGGEELQNENETS